MLHLFVTLSFSQTYIKDTSHVIPRVPTEEKMETYRENPMYSYDRNVKKPNTLIARIINWLIEKFLSLFSDHGAAPYIRYAIIIILIVIVVLKILNTDMQSLFLKSKKNIKMDYSIVEENLNNMNLDELINNAIRTQDFRMAVRFYFLKILKNLTEKNIINWKINKTNSEFLIEIIASKYYDDFKNICSIYDHVWYGKFSITQEKFLQIKNNYDNFISKTL